jgi:hypothetical protein
MAYLSSTLELQRQLGQNALWDSKYSLNGKSTENQRR